MVSARNGAVLNRNCISAQSPLYDPFFMANDSVKVCFTIRFLWANDFVNEFKEGETMKETLKKISDVFKLIFGYGIMIVLFAGGLTFFGYVAALMIGGETATNICTWIYKRFVPVMITTSTILILFGLLTMYLAGEKALTPGNKNMKTEGEK